MAEEFPRVRHFKGSGAWLMPRLSIGSCNRQEDITMMAIVRIPAGKEEYCLLRNCLSGGTARGFGFYITKEGKLNLRAVPPSEAENEVNGFTSKEFFTFDNHWKLVVARKAVGSAIPDFGVFDFVTREWKWQEAVEHNSGTKAQSVESTGRVQIGEGNGFNLLLGDMAMGFIGAVKSRAEIEALVGKGTLTEWKASAVGLWFFDQSAPEGEIVDQTGNGANRVQGGAGTEVLTPERPPIPYYNEVTQRAKVLIAGAIKSVKRWMLANGAVRQV